MVHVPFIHIHTYHNLEWRGAKLWNDEVRNTTSRAYDDDPSVLRNIGSYPN